jgi:hypothetical protein
MTLAFLVYLASLIGSLFVFFLVLAVFSFFMNLISMANLGESWRSEANLSLWRKRRNLSFWLCITCFVFIVFLPTQKTMYVMAGAYAAQKVYESPEAARISSKVVAIVEKQLDDILNEKVGNKSN